MTEEMGRNKLSKSKQQKLFDWTKYKLNLHIFRDDLYFQISIQSIHVWLQDNQQKLNLSKLLRNTLNSYQYDTTIHSVWSIVNMQS